MFGFLKDKLKSAIKKFTKDVDEKSEKIEEKAEKKEKKAPAKEKAKKKPVPAAPREKQKKKKEKAAGEEKKIQKREKAEEKEETKEEEIPEKQTKKEEKEAEQKEKEEKRKEKEKQEKETEKKEGAAQEKQEEKKEKEPEQKPEEKKGFFARLKETIFREKEEKTKKEKPEEAKREAKEEEQEKEEREGEAEEAEERKGAEEEAEEERKEETGEPEEEREEPEKEERKQEKKEEIPEPKKEEKGFFARIRDTITKTTLSEDKFNDIFWGLEVVLLENNVAVEAIDKIRGDLKETLVNQKIPRGKLEEHIQETLKASVSGLLGMPPVDLLTRIRQKKEKPFIIAFVGINGSGKTTTIAKLAHLLKKNSMTPVIAAADTFRAAAIQQLEEHGEKIGVRVIKHDYGADPAAVAFDAVKYAHAKSSDVVLIDTAGRMHSNTNLIDEMKKIVRVAKPDLKIFVGESITGNDCVEQARTFNEAISFDAIILTKADVDEKGGAALSVSYVTKKPISYFGVGQTYDDLEVFDKEKVMGSIGL